ncbi:MAG: lipid-A-disaccharide synthase [Verrucomicrobia bacterium]|nr:lipid-A-disaccharide synthase [Verrucomicrobiota bacterium]MCG2679303.1 lipid-A-disaccharide synthase [Kiritimatiellia bacterium]MBU4247320.1 lipid-A-disaccharide synthase [Verrucomicrobiota bacterium]MBU4292260.1 lipid-A-disaccharide synthase [Verrucomicrobiota bacterium]MBU4428280.1 lipid-A-disaccharide synthase [Verrucomicrobiota bacterium]
MKKKSMLIIAGEISGDMHAAALVRALQKRGMNVDIFGIGGDELRAAGMEIIVDAREMAVLGLTDVLLKYRFFRKTFYAMLTLARERRPDAILLVDYPGFNLRFAAQAHAQGLKVLYYICPQVWAWNRSRVPRMARIVDRLIAIFSLEADVFKGTGLPVDFVGHPLVTAARRTMAEPLVCLPWQGGEPCVAILPGSRYHEVKRILPTMWSAAVLLERRFPNASFIVAAPSDQVAQWIRDTLDGLDRGPARWSVVIGQTRQALRQARAAMVTSGTATIETALMRCPMIVVYKTSWITYGLGRLVIRVPFLGMVNIVAGEGLCPEFIQHRATPRALAGGLEPLLRDSPARTSMLNGLDLVIAAMGEPGAEERAADIVLAELSLRK